MRIISYYEKNKIAIKINGRIRYLFNPNDFSDWTQESAEQFIASKLETERIRLETERIRAEKYYQPPEEMPVDSP